MLILALDTSGKLASAALLQDGTLLGSETRDSMLDHSRTLLPMCSDLLARYGLALADVDLFAAVTGPGSFTGVRIGCAAVKGYAWSLGKPCLGVSSLLSAAWMQDSPGLVCASIRARQNESFYAIFRRTETGVERLTEDTVTGDDEMQTVMNGLGCETRIESAQSAVGAAYAAYAAHLAGETGNCYDLTPAYLRITQAERVRLERLKKEGQAQ